MEWLCLDFINSDWRDWRGSGKRENRLEKQEWLEWFTQTWELNVPIPVGEDISRSLLQLREHMRSIVETVVAGGAVKEADLDALNQALALAPAHMRVTKAEGTGYRLDSVSAVEGWPFVMGQIAGSFAELLTSQDVQRIKICDNEDCRWVFFDESRNRARRWCDDKMCGNLMKVRRFRERQKEKG